MVRNRINQRLAAVVRSRFGNIIPPSSSSSSSHDGLGTTFKHDLKPLQDLAELGYPARQKYQRGPVHRSARANRDDIHATTEIPKLSSSLMVVLCHHGSYLAALHAL